MLVEKLMTTEVEVCRPEASLAEAAAVMWRRDCGVVPVVGEGGAVEGMITDRDICMALATRRAYASDVKVGEVMARGVLTCTPEDDAREALELMRKHQLRRLPVVDTHGRLAGLLSLADVIRHTKKGGGKRHVPRRETLSTLKALVKPHGAAAHEPETPDEVGDEDEGAQAPTGDAATTDDASRLRGDDETTS